MFVLFGSHEMAVQRSIIHRRSITALQLQPCQGVDGLGSVIG